MLGDVTDLACPFCDADALRRDAFVLENDLCLFSVKPSESGALRGAGIIVPKAHRETVFDLTPDEWAATFDLLTRAKRHMDDTLRPDGYNVGWNVQRAGGQDVFHAHLHVLPRFADEPMAGKGIRAHLKGAANRRPERTRDAHAESEGCVTLEASP